MCESFKTRLATWEICAKYFEQSTKIMTSGCLFFRPRIFVQPRTELFLLRFLPSLTHDTFQLGNFLVSFFKKLALFKKGLQNGHRFFWRIAFSNLFLVWGLVQFAWVILESHPVKIMHPNYSCARCSWMICNGMLSVAGIVPGGLLSIST